MKSNTTAFNEDRCVCCGEYVPEGRMVCVRCKHGEDRASRDWERKKKSKKDKKHKNDYLDDFDF